jgi:hypothetical protein
LSGGANISLWGRIVRGRIVPRPKCSPHFWRFFHKLIWGRRYDHNFLRKNWRFSQKQCFDQIFAKTSCSSSKKRQKHIYVKDHNISSFLRRESIERGGEFLWHNHETHLHKSMSPHQGRQSFLGTLDQNAENRPNYHKIDQMAINIIKWP